MRTYNIRHRTVYQYGSQASLCHNEVRLTPNNTGRQKRLQTNLSVTPHPAVQTTYEDFFGNQVVAFSIQEPHDNLEIELESHVEVEPPNWLADSADTLSWEEVVALVRTNQEDSVMQFTLPSPYITLTEGLRVYTATSFTKGRPLAEATKDLMQRIHNDFDFKAGFTDISTPLSELLEHRKGVCQDFAQLGIGCLRSIGLPAGYVSGYIETMPPEGEEKLVGADASHAWFSVFHPLLGWMEYDPTNNMQPAGQHITVGYGRDFGDISPVKGIMVGSGSHEIEVSVDVVPEPLKGKGG